MWRGKWYVYPRLREDCRTRKRQENEIHASAGQAGCWTHHGRAEYGKGHAVVAVTNSENYAVRRRRMHDHRPPRLSTLKRRPFRAALLKITSQFQKRRPEKRDSSRHHQRTDTPQHPRLRSQVEHSSISRRRDEHTRTPEHPIHAPAKPSVRNPTPSAAICRAQP